MSDFKEISQLLKELVESNKRIITLLESASVRSAPAHKWSDATPSYLRYFLPVQPMDSPQPAPGYWPPVMPIVPTTAPNIGTAYAGSRPEGAWGGQTEASR